MELVSLFDMTALCHPATVAECQRAAFVAGDGRRTPLGAAVTGCPRPVRAGKTGQRGGHRLWRGVGTAIPAASSRPYSDPSISRQRFGFLRSEEHTSELQSLRHLVCRLL